MTTIIINNKPIRIHATVVARVQNLLEAGESIETVRQKTGLSKGRASALIDTIQGQSQMGRVACVILILIDMVTKSFSRSF